MARTMDAHDRGTRFTNYSSIHSADAFVGEYQVMYTPGSNSPQFQRQAGRKPSRFSKVVSTTYNNANTSQSFLLPANIPNTSQIMPNQGMLPNIQVPHSIPADEKQIVASLRNLQRDLAEAVETINELTRERDEALHELRLVRATARKPLSPIKKQNVAERVEEELFDLSRSEESFKRLTQRQASGKKVTMDRQVTASDNARVLSPIPAELVNGKLTEKRVTSRGPVDGQKQYKKPVAEETEQSMGPEDPTAASNTSRRRRRPSVDDNMTSAYILPDITEQQIAPPQVSKEAQNVLHSLEPEHVAHCDVCRRLTATSANRPSRASRQKSVSMAPPQQPRSIPPRQSSQVAKVDYTAQALGFNVDNQIGFAPDESVLPADATLRPKIAPSHALSRVRILMDAQFVRAKERHHAAWLKYDSIEAPLSSRRHAAVSKEMRYWAEKMEECRVHLDYLRDVEEGMDASVEVDG